MPGKGEKPFGLDVLHDHLPFKMFITRMSDLAAGGLTRHKRTIELHTKPLAKFPIVGQGAPNAGYRRLQLNSLFNTVVHSQIPPNLMVAQFCYICNHIVAIRFGRSRLHHLSEGVFYEIRGSMALS